MQSSNDQLSVRRDFYRRYGSYTDKWDGFCKKFIGPRPKGSRVRKLKKWSRGK